MKIVFVGPSLAQSHGLRCPGIEFRPPAVQGDIMRALSDGANVIGLIDGQFEYVAPVWHKELLYALKAGVAVFGAASMGALRGAECAAFGMVGIGRIFEDYASGRRLDDADVALVHAPAELGYQALTVPLVNVDATLEKACAIGLLDGDEAGRLHAIAQAIHFKERTWKRIAEAAGSPASDIRRILVHGWTDQKQLDALALVAAMDTWAAPEMMPENRWSFNATPLWRQFYD
jgi:hypothetical protein